MAWERKPPQRHGSLHHALLQDPARAGHATSPVVLPFRLPGNLPPKRSRRHSRCSVRGPGWSTWSAPRYVPNDTLIWTSTNGGVTFSGPVKVTELRGPDRDRRRAAQPEPHGDRKRTDRGLLRRRVRQPGFGFGEVANTLKSPAEFSFSEPGTFVDEGEPRLHRLAPAGGGLRSTSKNTTRSTTTSLKGARQAKKRNGRPRNRNCSPKATSPRLASGPAGLLILSSDFVRAAKSNPAVLEVRKFNESTNTFEAPVQVTSNRRARTASTSGHLREPGNGLHSMSSGRRPAMAVSRCTSRNQPMAVPELPRRTGSRVLQGGFDEAAAPGGGERWAGMADLQGRTRRRGRRPHGQHGPLHQPLRRGAERRLDQRSPGHTGHRHGHGRGPCGLRARLAP